MTARIHCCVPFCTKTYAPSLPVDPDQEVCCLTHIKPVSKRLRKLHTEAKKRAKAIMDKYPEPEDAPQAERDAAVRYVHAEKWLWKKIKSQAIERAGGIA
jgi:hypothetical protein